MMKKRMMNLNSMGMKKLLQKKRIMRKKRRKRVVRSLKVAEEKRNDVE